jgi:hypothetical protein
MTPNQYFPLVLRGIGAWNAIEGLDHFVTALNVQRGFYSLPYTKSEAFVTHGLFHLFVGILLLRGAEIISDFIIPVMQTSGEDNLQADEADT